MSDKDFYLYINGEAINVNEDVYREYKRAEEKEHYFMKRLKKGRFISNENEEIVYIPSREQSYEKLLEMNWEFPSSEEPVENTAIKSYMMKKLDAALNTLSNDELKIIYELFFLKKSEREVCASLNMAKSTFHYQKIKILKKLKKQIEK